MRLITETINFFTHPRRQLNQLAFVIHFVTTKYDFQTSLVAIATTAKSAATVPVILTS